MAVKSFDPKCYELAEHFLADHPDIDTELTREDLARELQATIDAWMEEWRTALPGR